MKINVLNAYNNPYANSLSENLASNGISINGNVVQKNTEMAISKSSEETLSDGLLTKKERTFFKKLFPENSDQIEKHVLFNRNGKLHNANVNKGVIFDGRI